jgi:hypothetical protein
MLHGVNPNSWPEFAWLRAMLALQQQTPTKEWPLLYVEEHDALLVVREWPDGSVTSYTLSGDDIRPPTDDGRSG